MDPRRILIVRLGALGDILHTLPAQQALRSRMPEAEIHWLTESPYRQLLETIPGMTRVWTVDTKKWRRKPIYLAELRRLRRDLREQHFDVALDFQGLLKSAVLAKLSGARVVYGFKPERFKETAAAWFYSRSVDGEANLSRHANDTNLRLANLLIEGNGVSGRLPIRIPPGVEERIGGHLRAAGAERPIAISPGAGWKTKLWPARRFGALGREIEDRLAIPVVFTHGPGEIDLIEEVRREFPAATILPTSILELAALINRSRLFVAGDTGPLHLAAALGTPTVSIMGPTSSLRNGSFNRDDEVVQWNLPCSNCYKRTCNEFVCMNIPVREVLRAVARRLDKAYRTP